MCIFSGGTRISLEKRRYGSVQTADTRWRTDEATSSAHELILVRTIARTATRLAFERMHLARRRLRYGNLDVRWCLDSASLDASSGACGTEVRSPLKVRSFEATLSSPWVSAMDLGPSRLRGRMHLRHIQSRSRSILVPRHCTGVSFAPHCRCVPLSRCPLDDIGRSMPKMKN